MDDLEGLDFNINITSNSEENKGEPGHATQPGWAPIQMNDDSKYHASNWPDFDFRTGRL